MVPLHYTDDGLHLSSVATLDGNGVISIIRNAGEWTCSAVGYKSLTSITSVAKSTISIDSSREPKTAQK
jgi:hypothetical protein